MNKKFLSFVLAMVLTVGLGSSIVFAGDPYEKTGGATSADWVSTSDNGNGGFTYTIPDEDKAEVGKVESKVCQVFNYRSGVLLSAMDQDRNVTIFSAGKQLLTLSYTDDKTFKVSGVNLSGTDWDTISKQEGNTPGQKLKNFLLSLGIQESALKASKVDSTNKTIDTSTQVDVAWLEKAAETLQKGINYSISIDLTGTYGASMTWSVNGKPQETIGYDGKVLETYNYNEAGTLESISKLTYKVDDVNGDSSKVKYKPETTTIYMDEDGRQSYATDSNGKEVMRYTYSANGSLESVYSSENKSTTYYSAGKTSFVVNDQGFITDKYDYHPNGSLNGVTTKNYDKDTGKITETSVTAYKWGRAVGSGKNLSYDELRDAIAELKSNPNAVKEALKAGAANQTGAKNTSVYAKITSISLYENDLNNSALMSFLEIGQSDINKMRAMSNGISAVANVQVTLDTIDFGTDTNTVSSSMGTHSYHKVVSSSITQKGKVGQQMSFKITVMDRGGQSYVFNGAKQELRAPVNQKKTDYFETDPAVEGKLWSSEPTDEELAAAMKEKGIDENDEEAVAALKKELSQAKLEAKAKELGIDLNDEQAMEDLKNGFYTDSTGQTFAILETNSINIMDGSGFQAANGETVLIGLSNPALKKSITDNIKNNGGDRSIMFMGDVRQSTTGFLTMTMNTNYGGGVVQGTEEVNAARDNIMLASIGQAIKNGMDITEVSAALDTYNQKFGTNFTTQDANDKLNNLSEDDAWIVNNTNANMKLFNGQQTEYKVGWDLLVEQLAAIF